jgi:hypothetical protein
MIVFSKIMEDVVALRPLHRYMHMNEKSAKSYCMVILQPFVDPTLF